MRGGFCVTRRWIVTLLAGSVALAAAGAGLARDATVVSAAATAPAMEFTLPQAVERALAHGPAMAQARLNFDQAKLSADQGQSAARGLSPEVISSLDQAKAKYVSERSAQLTEAAKDRDLKVAELNARQQAEEAYYRVLKADDAVSIGEADLDRAKKQLALVKTQYAAGVKSRLDVLTAESEAAQADVALLQARRGRLTAVMQLNQTLGLPLETPLKLVTRFAEEPAGAPPDLTAAIEEALKRRPDVTGLADALELARLTLDLTARYYTPNVYTYRQAELDLRGAELALKRKQTDVELEVRSAHGALRDAGERLELLRGALEQAREAYRVANLMYENGLSTSQELAAARVALMRAETQAAQAVFDYNLAWSRFRLATADGA